MNAVIGVLAVVASLQLVGPPTDLDCEMSFVISMRYEVEVADPLTACSSSQPQAILLGPPTLDRQPKESQRLELLQGAGWVWPQIVPGSESDYGHTAPSAIKSVRVMRMCCHYGPNVPLPEWWCKWPDGEPIRVY